MPCWLLRIFDFCQKAAWQKPLKPNWVNKKHADLYRRRQDVEHKQRQPLFHLGPTHLCCSVWCSSAGPSPLSVWTEVASGRQPPARLPSHPTRIWGRSWCSRLEGRREREVRPFSSLCRPFISFLFPRGGRCERSTPPRRVFGVKGRAQHTLKILLSAFHRVVCWCWLTAASTALQLFQGTRSFELRHVFKQKKTKVLCRRVTLDAFHAF